MIAVAAGTEAHNVRALLDCAMAELGAGPDPPGSPAGQQPSVRAPLDGYAA